MATFTTLIVFCLTLLFFNSDKFKLTHANELCTSSNSGNMTNAIEEQGMKLYPLIDKDRVEKMMVMNETRRKLGSFQICAPCTCCGAKGYCLPSPCCYAINCNIPNRPFGFCSFTPKYLYVESVRFQNMKLTSVQRLELVPWRPMGSSSIRTL